MASVVGSVLLLSLLFSATVLTAEAAAASALHRPPDCPASCGSISVPYPFGTAGGCAMPGFSLVCDHETDPPKLFLPDGSVEVIDVSLDPVMDVRMEIATMRADADSRNVSWAPPPGAPYVLSTTSAASNLTLTVVGCSAMAYLLDLDSGSTIASCVTVCGDGNVMEAMEGAACSGVGCCQATFSSSLRSYGIRLVRVDRPGGRWAPASNVKAFVSDDQNAYMFSKEDLFEVDTVRNSTTASAILRWAITGALSCADAVGTASYACLSNNSVCSDDITSGFGYYCVCALGYDGNPYVPGGCGVSTTPSTEVVSSSDHPKSDCPTSCGNITVPFPFGLAPGCYRDESYHMECLSNEYLRFTDIAMDIFYVKEILLEEGQVRVYKAEETLKIEGINPSSGPYTFFNEWVMFNWTIGGSSCDEAKNGTKYACLSGNSVCRDAAGNSSGYLCRCAAGYSGNPYVLDGCRDIDECADPDKHICSGICINFDGGYSCCPPGSQVEYSTHECIPQGVQSQTIMIGVAAGVSSGCGFLLVLISAVLLNRRLKEMKQKRMKERHFHQNHGFLLQKLISSDAVHAERRNIFSLEELEKATGNFDATRILGHGGHGTVYKGILSDQRVVAVKKSRIAVRRETNQFINEIAILSQINHRNVVRLYGCCLETEVPLLVFEYITNGTLADHLHAGSSSLPWEDRLRIASEIAGALAYLHSAASISVFHRDVKSSNVLLDESLTAKVSDFGASRHLPVHHTHITTGVQGTHGYLDPEYYHTGRLTDKSDVYSFGVILLELLTGMKPVSSTRFGEMNLAMYFNWAAKMDCAVEIFEARVKAEGKKEELEKVAALAKECLMLSGAERPSMKEVEMRMLEVTRRKEEKKRLCCADHYGEEDEGGGQSFDADLIGRARERTSRCHSLEEEFMSSLDYGR